MRTTNPTETLIQAATDQMGMIPLNNIICHLDTIKHDILYCSKFFSLKVLHYYLFFFPLSILPLNPSNKMKNMAVHKHTHFIC